MTFLDRLKAIFAAPVVSTPLPSATEPLLPVLAVGEPNWLAVLRAAGFRDPEGWAAAIAGPARRRAIGAGRRAAAFAATIGHESIGGTALVESMNYTPERLRVVWPARFSVGDAHRWGRVGDRPADQVAIAERAYGGRMGNGPEGTGDGFRYRGRGLIQLTGRDAYAMAGDATGLPLLLQPELASTHEGAAEIACWVWSAWKGCNGPADAGDIEGWRRRINGGLIGLEDVRKR